MGNIRVLTESPRRWLNFSSFNIITYSCTYGCITDPWPAARRGPRAGTEIQSVFLRKDCAAPSPRARAVACPSPASPLPLALSLSLSLPLSPRPPSIHFPLAGGENSVSQLSQTPPQPAAVSALARGGDGQSADGEAPAAGAHGVGGRWSGYQAQGESRAG
jgi:hypothetical protein